MRTRLVALSLTLGLATACSEADRVAAATDTFAGAGGDAASASSDAAIPDAGEPGPGEDDDVLGADVAAPDASNVNDAAGADDTVGEVGTAPGDVAELEDAAVASPDTDSPLDTSEGDATLADVIGADVLDANAGGDAGAPDAITTTAPADPGIAGTVKYTKSSDSIALSGGLFPTSIGLTLFTPNGLTSRPVVIFTHGFQLAASDYDTLAEHLASWGYVVILPDLGGGFTATHVQQRDKLVKVLDWVVAGADAASGPLAGVADKAKIVMAGHSMGGKLSFLVAADDPRPVAIFGVDPVDAAGGPIAMDPASFPSVTPERMGDIDVPFMVVGETKNGSGGLIGTPCAPAADNFHQYFANATGPAAEIEFLGAFHMSWLDDPGCLVCFACDKGTADDDTVKALTSRYFVAFLEGVVEGKTEYLAWTTGAAMQPDVAAGYVKTDTKNGFPTAP
jgi:pimeloyl-ACP methyl ester carboxylesterase